MKTTLRRGLVTLCALVALSTTPARATTVWNFTGTCSDCPDIGQGVLTATPVGNSTTFTFSYVSDWISYTMTNPSVSVDETLFTGLGFTIPTGLSVVLFQANVDILSFGGAGNPLGAATHTMDTTFFLGSSGFWQTGPQVPLDFGTNGTFTQGNSAVPEPATLGLVGISAGLLLLRQWRQGKG